VVNNKVVQMNSGERLLNIYTSLVQQSPNKDMVKTWAKVFGLDADGNNLEDEVVHLVLGLRHELTFARGRLTAQGAPSELTSPAFERLASVASPGQLHSSWASHLPNINPAECRKIFEWVAWTLRDEGEADMSADEMQTLRGELESLEAALADVGMAPYLRDFIERQIKTIREALRMYGVRGVKPVREALQQVAGAYKTEEKQLARAVHAASEPQKTVFARAAGAIKKVAEFADTISKLKQGADDAISIGQSVGDIVTPYLNTQLPNL